MFENTPFIEYIWETASGVDLDLCNCEWLRKYFTKTMEVFGEVWGFIASFKTDTGKEFTAAKIYT